ncbi:undecaprenyldiphospho-muramoylpentapeptide beta-N-acetylglucosaminyltransferase [Coxiella-like endosymbiont of Amblyomma americanum]|uniref:undecaprenyldiphospho-muramoylpentapeptide beta-N-acetylglucosaminyltransferase n=1 Tax=Coxiella-like endosymbiont of Amblyomma americanum TaxID=1987500 RepID=UPI000F89EAFF|nr:undecaprenyldiphospho-muramoylpentapeptide beta-N-acetylglucosaminyltransferase [Coxiella-like endosymbiont of Amblyomma americanum]AUJ58735.1 undecaprenyldiphospho-muramoylpentapeptide beta-N-acetylglucosaminyltransferase [Coxiella-like endosymbiont of Amblyomma americanum]
MKRILIISGGTGGHIFPALEVARALQYQGIEIYWLGTTNGLEKKLVAHEFPLNLIKIKSCRKEGLMKKILMLFPLIKVIFQSYLMIRKMKPKMVLGMGGCVSGPVGFAAWLHRIPIVIHEQNVVAGLTNRLLAKIAKSILQAFPGTFSCRKNVSTTGNPIRAELIHTPLPRERLMDRTGPLRVLILGGSQGAHSINQKIMIALRNYPHPEKLAIWHQTGLSDFKWVKGFYEIFSFEVRVDVFIDEITKAYTWADLIICRAGALTVSEITAVGIASIVIPYPYSTDNHQFYNGRFLEKKGAAIVIPEKLLTVKCLVNYLKQFIKDRSRLLIMAERARSLAKSGAVQRVVDECKRML